MQIALKIAIVGLCVFLIVVILYGSFCLSSMREKYAWEMVIALSVCMLAAITSCTCSGHAEVESDRKTDEEIMGFVQIGFCIVVFVFFCAIFLIVMREKHALVAIALLVCMLATCFATAPAALLLGVAGHGSVLTALKEQRHRLHFVGC